MKRAFLLLAALAVMLPAGASAATRTTVTLDGYSPLLNAGFYGTVKSPRTKCKDGRRVIVYHRDPGPDTRIGTDRAEVTMESTYFWFVEESSAPHGAYYAKARPTDGCEGDRSPVFKIQEV